MPRPTQVTPARKVLLQVVLWGGAVVGLLIAWGAKYTLQDRFRLPLEPATTASTLEYRVPTGWQVQRTVSKSNVVIVAHEPTGQKRVLTIEKWNGTMLSAGKDALAPLLDSAGSHHAIYEMREGEFSGIAIVMSSARGRKNASGESVITEYIAAGELADGSVVRIQLQVDGQPDWSGRGAPVLLHDIARSLHARQADTEPAQLDDLVGQETI